MDPDKKKRLERLFDRELTDGEAAEIEHTQVLPRDGEAFYENGGLADGTEEGADADELFLIGMRGIRYPN